MDNIINKINSLQKEIMELTYKADAYYELAGSPKYPKDVIIDKAAYTEYKNIIKKINSKQASLQKLYAKLN